MVRKIAGFLTGAGIAGLGVLAWSALTDVSDEDRLASVIVDHCIPFVQTGAVPFEGVGRPAGVYDQANLSGRITNGANTVLYDNRFVAQWGESIDVNSAVRVCIVKDSYSDANSIGFAYDIDALQNWVNTVAIAGTDLVATHSTPNSFPTVLVWEAPNTVERFSGLRLVMTATQNGVSQITIVDDLDG